MTTMAKEPEIARNKFADPLNIQLKACSEALQIHREMTVRMLQIFLFVHGNEGCTIRDVADYAGINTGTASRNIAALGGKPMRGATHGIFLVEAEIDSQDPRLRHLHLTKKGKAFAAHLRRVLEN